MVGEILLSEIEDVLCPLCKGDGHIAPIDKAYFEAKNGVDKKMDVGDECRWCYETIESEDHYCQ